MSANNYYGFNHAGTQYGAQYSANTNPTNQYTTAPQQPQYGVSANPGSVQAGGAGYSTVQEQSYVIGGYARPISQPVTPQGQQQYSLGYGQSSAQPGYQTAQKPSPGPIGSRAPTPNSTVYPTYSGNTAGAASSFNVGFTQPAAAPATKTGTSFTNYDAAVYNAVSAYAQGGIGGGRGPGLGYKGRGGAHQNKLKGPRPPPKPQTLHYCDVCKISCAGPQTYKEHLDGQKHKKKEALMKAGVPAVPKGSPAGLRCELCDVTCTGSDAYAAHIRGAKHQKVLKLHTKLGKPIPSDNPTVIQPAGGAPSGPTALKKVPLTKTNSASGPTFVKPAPPPKISFLGPKPDYDRYNTGAQSNNNGNNNASEMESSQDSVTISTAYPVSVTSGSGTTDSPSGTAEVGKSPIVDYIEKDIEPVGVDYIEEIRTDDGKGISFNCKLCDCKFNDPNAKEMHMKGRRHRLQFKKKVNPELVVDVKPSSRQKKLDERRGRGRRGLGMGPGNSAEPFGRGMPLPLLPPGGPRGYGHGPIPPVFVQPNPMFFIPPLIRRSESRDDRHVMAKHGEIYPKEDELQAIQRIVSTTEKALKFVSDEIAEVDSKATNGVTVKSEEGSTEPKKPEAETKLVEADLQAHRVLKGVMRVGNLAKGLLLRGDRSVHLVVLCSVKPTLSLLDRVLDALPKQLETVAGEEKYEIQRKAAEAGLSVISISEPKIEVVVTFTSPLVRATSAADGEATATTVKEPDDLLDKEKCLDALAALRHAKWFQARATALQSCVIIIRVLRDLCQRVAAWNSLNPWTVELLAEKAINSAGMPISPGEGLKLVFETIAHGLILPTGPGLLDPCEKDIVDAIGGLTPQAKQDITAYAQQALRLIQFRLIHKVLEMEELPRFKKGSFASRKRRRNNSAGADGEEQESADGKKDKKEGDEAMESEPTPTPVEKTD